MLKYDDSFRDLQNYTTLKRATISTIHADSFRGLQNYTTLKHLQTAK